MTNKPNNKLLEFCDQPPCCKQISLLCLLYLYVDIQKISEIQISRILRPASLVCALIAGNDLRPAYCQKSVNQLLASFCKKEEK